MLFFAYAAGLASRDDNPLAEFQVAGADGAFVPARARIDRSRRAGRGGRQRDPARGRPPQEVHRGGVAPAGPPAVNARPERDQPGQWFEKSNRWKWDPHTPDRITCAASSVTFPDTDYPVKTKRVKVLSGKMVDVPYYDSPSGRAKCLVQARIDCEKTIYLTRALSTLARDYAATRDERYARRVAVALDAWAACYPDYFLTQGQNGTEPINPEEGAKTGF